LGDVFDAAPEFGIGKISVHQKLRQYSPERRRGFELSDGLSVIGLGANQLYHLCCEFWRDDSACLQAEQAFDDDGKRCHRKS
jgi:hypothetical protein